MVWTMSSLIIVPSATVCTLIFSTLRPIFEVSSQCFFVLCVVDFVVQLPSCVQLFVTPRLQHTRPPCPSPSPGICPSSWSLHQWHHPAVSSSDTLLFFCPQSFLASGTFPMSNLCTSDDQYTGASGLVSVPSVNIQGWSPLRLTGWSLCCPRDLQQSSPVPQFEGINSLAFCLLDSTALTTVCDHWEDHILDYTDLCLSMCGGGDIVTKSYPTLVILWNVACQLSLSMEFSRQECWSG